MKLKKFIAALMAAVLMTSTAAYADDSSSKNEKVVEINVKNSKGTYAFTDEELAAYIDYNAQVNGFGEDAEYDNSPAYIIGEDSSLDFPTGETFRSYGIYSIVIELIDIEKDEQGNTIFKQLFKNGSLWSKGGGSPIWYLFDFTYGYRAYDTAEKLFLGNYSHPTTFPVTEIIKTANADSFYKMTDYEFSYDDVDMVAVYFHTQLVDGKFVSPYEFGKDDNFINPQLNCKWYFTEKAASMLKEANGAVSAVPEKPASFKAVPKSTTSIKLSWKDNGADSYNIYRATSKNGTYKKIASTTKNTYTNKSLTKGKTYYYKVTAVIDGEESEFSKIVSSKPTSPIPSAVKASSKASGEATITWKKSTGAKGYEVYMATSKSGTYKRVDRVGSKVLAFTEDELTEGKTYYFKVRSYTIKNGTRIYSPFSSVVKIKV